MSYLDRVQQRPIIEFNILGIVAGIKQVEPCDDTRIHDAFQITIKATGENPHYPASLEPVHVMLGRGAHINPEMFGYTIADKRVIVPLSMVFTKINIIEIRQDIVNSSISSHGKILSVAPEVLFYDQRKTLRGPVIFSKRNRAMGVVEYS